MEAGGGVQQAEGGDVDRAVGHVPGGVDLDDVDGPHPGVPPGQEGRRQQLAGEEPAGTGAGAGRGEGGVEDVDVEIDVDVVDREGQAVERLDQHVFDGSEPHLGGGHDVDPDVVAPAPVGDGVGEPGDADLHHLVAGEAGVDQGPDGRPVARPALVGADVVVGVERDEPPPLDAVAGHAQHRRVGDGIVAAEEDGHRRLPHDVAGGGGDLLVRRLGVEIAEVDGGQLADVDVAFRVVGRQQRQPAPDGPRRLVAPGRLGDRRDRQRHAQHRQLRLGRRLLRSLAEPVGRRRPQRIPGPHGRSPAEPGPLTISPPATTAPIRSIPGW